MNPRTSMIIIMSMFTAIAAALPGPGWIAILPLSIGTYIMLGVGTWIEVGIIGVGIGYIIQELIFNQGANDLVAMAFSIIAAVMYLISGVLAFCMKDDEPSKKAQPTTIEPTFDRED